jgi:bifunctional non-homologous end joining protein LigD
MALETYRRKRNFRKTPEPRGKIVRKTEARPAFVVHKHAARRLHYDLRLEMAGVLASWAVPKGPSYDPKERRLAVEVEDHPFDYGAFEGTIPAGEYGAGKVIVWDRGYWVPAGDPLAGRRQGKLKFQLFGDKLRGGWTLVRIRRPREGGAKTNWLLIKENDDFAAGRDIVSERPESVTSGRTLEEIGDENDAPQTPRKTRRRAPRKRAPAGKTAALRWIEPQLATLVTAVPAGSQWLHELKFDGYRLLCRIDHGRVSLLTRHAQDWTERFAAVVQAAKQLPASQALLDGEVVALEDDGTHSFQRLQNSLSGGDPSRLIYYVFDLVHLDGRDLGALPLIERKDLLKKLFSRGARKNAKAILRYSEHWIDQGEELFAKACAAGLEGILAKRGDDPYRSGRTRSWLKIKCAKSQEFVIAGFTDPAGARVGFGALLLGVHDESGALRYAGKVGTGFDDRALRDLHARLKALEQKAQPFAGVKRADFRKARWVEPRLVCEVGFAGWTTDGLLRHASFKGLREDKAPGEVSREVPAANPPARGGADGDGQVAGVKLTHPERVLYPEQGITKRELALYYERVGAAMLPHLEGRPLTVVRCPEGRAGQCFYQRHAREGITEPIRSIAVRERGKTARYLSIDSLPGLIALAQMGILEIHTWGSRAPRIERPDRLTFDLDPGPGVGWKEIAQAALRLRARLEEFELGAFAKTTGGKGLHVVAPIAPEQSWEVVKNFSRALAESVVGEAPGSYTATASKAKRRGKIFIDYLRNSRTATAVCAYSTRARPGAPVSLPVEWQELEKDPRASFTIRTVPERLEKRPGDPWRDYEDARRALTTKLIRRLR